MVAIVQCRISLKCSNQSRLVVATVMAAVHAIIVFMLTQPFGDHVYPLNEGIITLGEFTHIRMAGITWMDVILG